MLRTFFSSCVALFLVASYQQAACAIKVTSVDSGSASALSLALAIIDGVDVQLAPLSVPSITGDLSAIGEFSEGITAPGTPLPDDNQNSASNATYSGGIGIASGVCLCTGLLNDNELASPPGRGVGVQGPNNGDPIDTVVPGMPLIVNEGEISKDLDKPVDNDFESTLFAGTGSAGGDATVLEFEIETSAPGFLRISLVFSSDEFPDWVSFPGQDINDAAVMFINGQNILLLRKIITSQVVDRPLTIREIDDCSPKIFFPNQIAPSPANMFPTDHEIPGGVTTYYDHEFAGFSKVLTFETCKVLPKTTMANSHRIKIVIQDVADRLVDSAVFLEQSSLKLFPFIQGDLDLDGDVDIIDVGFLSANFGQPGTFGYVEGDLDNDGDVDIIDFGLLADHFGEIGGNKNYCGDFNRDGALDAADQAIWQQFNGLTQCASRFEGDADRDGDVDNDDLTALNNAEVGKPSTGLCGCDSVQHLQGGSGGAALAALPAGAAQATAIPTPSLNHPLDFDQDGDIDADDIGLFLQLKAATE